MVADSGTLYDQVDVGDYHTCAITVNRVLKCWGANVAGQIGIGAASTSATAPAIVGQEYIAIALSGLHSCGIRVGGELLCWGNNENQQISATVTHQIVLMPLSIDQNVPYVAVSIDGVHSCGVRQNGELRCWGNSLPASVSTLPSAQNIVSISVGLNHKCYVVGSGGALYCWGANAFGQLGNNSSQSQPSAVAIDSSQSYSSVDAGVSHTCGIRSDGELRCWGSNSFSALGIFYLFNHRIPIEVLFP